MPKLEDRGSDEAAKIGKQAAEKMKDDGGVAGKMASVAGKLGRGGGGGETVAARRRAGCRSSATTDVAVPRRDRVPGVDSTSRSSRSFMHRVLSVEEEGNNKVSWREKIWFSTREWEGEITERRKNERIAWKTKSGTQHSGIVSFHKIGDNLTRVMVTVDFHPTGMFEKLGARGFAS